MLPIWSRSIPRPTSVEALLKHRSTLGRQSIDMIDSLPFLPLALRFRTFWLGHTQKSKFWEQPGVVAGHFALSFSLNLFEHFCAYLRLHLEKSLWSGHQWKDLFLLQKLSIDDANFGQKRWRQKRKKGQGSSRAVTGGTGINGLISNLTSCRTIQGVIIILISNRSHVHPILKLLVWLLSELYSTRSNLKFY